MVKPGKKIANVEKKKRRPQSVNFAELRAMARKKKGSGSGSANFAKLRDDLFHEAAKLVMEDPSQSIAIIIAPRASKPNGTMQSFGYPSTEGVVRKFLKDSAPPVPAPEEDDEKVDDDDEEDEDWSKYCWWEDEKILNSKDPVEIMAAMEEMKKLQKQLEMYRRHLGESETGQGSGTKDDGSKP